MMRFYQLHASHFLFVFPLLALLVVNTGNVNAKPNGKGNGGGTSSPSEFVPMTLDSESYFFRVPDETSCLGEDDELEWRASGSLAPGESFTYTPRVTACNSHSAAITVVASWESGALDLSAVVPDIDYSSWDAEQAGRLIEAPLVGYSAQLCMFPSFTGDGINYSITLTNNTSENVNGISMHGRHENDWSIFYYPRCLNADADGDGWNDSLEHSMAILVYPNGYINGVLQPDILWGSNYLRNKAQTPLIEDEIDSYPADFNDDGKVDSLDLAILEAELGQGNGIPLEDISPNPGLDWFHENTLPWRRYDLDGDGFVGQEDRQIVSESSGTAVPMTSDVVTPTARITEPLDGASVPRGQYVLIKSHAWDNASIAEVNYMVDGRSICAVSDPRPDFGFTSPLYFCWWEVPRRAKTYEIDVRVTDSEGNTGFSDAITVQAE